MRDIDGGFPTDSSPYTEEYDYLSDSDLEDGSSCSEVDEEEPPKDSAGDPQERIEDADSAKPLPVALASPPPCSSTVEITDSQEDNRSATLYIVILGFN